MTTAARPAFSCPAHAAEAFEAAERRVARLLAEERAERPEDGEDAVANVPGSGEPPD